MAKSEVKRQHYDVLNCIICKSEIKSSFKGDKVSIETVNETSFDRGMAARISYGYGSPLDGRVYIIALCEDCTKIAVEEKRLIYSHNYIYEYTV